MLFFWRKDYKRMFSEEFSNENNITSDTLIYKKKAIFNFTKWALILTALSTIFVSF